MIMIVSRGFSFGKLIAWSAHHMVWLLLLSGAIAYLYHANHILFSIPWLPVSVIGTAVAFYVGFKNNQSYDRMWEARKIWGGIVNDSRTWGMMVDGYVTNTFRKDKASPQEISEIKQRLIYRHIGWLYAHREQLLVPTSWEHVSQKNMIGRAARKYQVSFGVGMMEEELAKVDLSKFLSNEEYDRLTKHKNTATQIINEQSRDLRKLRDLDLIDDFRHMEMTNVLRTFYELQGKNERIKKFPFPRQYAIMSRYFVGFFIALLPFSMIPELIQLGSWGLWLSIPITALIGYVYVMMEIVGDYSENPFQGLANDIPMLSLCRVIEIDLREMLGETKLPEPIQAKKDILM
jgi:ion channel-forming bestrophin family protein